MPSALNKGMGRKNKRIGKGRVSRIGSYAIASSITDPACVSCTTFNILAPIYKRLNHEVNVRMHMYIYTIRFHIGIYVYPSIWCWYWFMFVNFWAFWGRAGFESQRKRCERLLVEQEPSDFGLVVMWKIFDYLSPGFDFFTLHPFFLVKICLLMIFKLFFVGIGRNFGLVIKNLLVYMIRGLRMLAT